MFACLPACVGKLHHQLYLGTRELQQPCVRQARREGLTLGPESSLDLATQKPYCFASVRIITSFPRNNFTSVVRSLLKKLNNI